MNLFKTTRVVVYPICLQPMFLTIYPFGICRIDCDIDWLEDFRIYMFPTSKHDYPFLRRHLFGKWWIFDSTKMLMFPKNPDYVKCQTGGVTVWKSIEEYLKVYDRTGRKK